MTIKGLDLHHALGIEPGDEIANQMNVVHYRFAEGDEGWCEECANEKAGELLTSECVLLGCRVMEKCTCDKFNLRKEIT